MIITLIVEVRIYHKVLHICDTYSCDYLPQNTIRFYLIDCQLKTDSHSEVCVFIVKLLSVTPRSVSHENALKRTKTCGFFFAKLWTQIILLLQLKAISGFQDSEV